MELARDLLSGLNPLLGWIARASLGGAVLALLILAVQAALRERLAPRWRYALWLLLVARLALPWAPASRLSVYNLAAPLARWVAAGTEAGRGAGGAERSTPPASDVRTEGTPGVREYAPAGATEKLAPSGVGKDAAKTQRPQTGPSASHNPQPAIKPSMPSISSMPPPSAIERAGATPTPPDSAFRIPQSALLDLGLVLGWLAGVAGLLGLALIQSFRLAAAAGRARPVTDQPTLELLEECKTLMGVRAWLVVTEVPGMNSPALCGFIRPRLLLPEGAIGALGPERLRHVFLHELAHLKRRDIALNWLLTLLQALHWFNPLVWVAFARMRGDREMACDAMALARLKPDEAPDYGRTIVHMLERYTLPGRLPGLAGILEEKAQIKRRITMIAKFKKHSLAWSLGAALIMIALGAAALTSASPSSQTAAKTKKETVKSQANPGSPAGARLEEARKNLEASRELFKAKAISQAEMEWVQTEYELAQAAVTGDTQAAAQARLEAARKNLARMEALFKVKALSADELDWAQTAVRIAQADVDHDPLAAAQARMERAQHILERARKLYEARVLSQAQLARAEGVYQRDRARYEELGGGAAKNGEAKKTDPAADQKTTDTAERMGARARLKTAEDTYRRAKAMHDAGLLPLNDFSKAEFDYKSALAWMTGDAKAAAQARVAYSENILRYASAMFNGGVGPRSEVLKAEAELKDAQAALDRLGGAVAAPSSTPTPTPTPKPAAAEEQRAAQARLEAAQALYKTLKAQYDLGTMQDSRDLFKAETALKVAEAELAGDAKAAARARRDGAKKIYEILKKRNEAGITAVYEVIQAEREMKVAEAELAGDARAAAQARVECNRKLLLMIAQRQKVGLSTTAELAQARADVATAEAELAKFPATDGRTSQTASAAPPQGAKPAPGAGAAAAQTRLAEAKKRYENILNAPTASNASVREIELETAFRDVKVAEAEAAGDARGAAEARLNAAANMWEKTMLMGMVESMGDTSPSPYARKQVQDELVSAGVALAKMKEADAQASHTASPIPTFNASLAHVPGLAAAKPVTGVIRLRGGESPAEDKFMLDQEPAGSVEELIAKVKARVAQKPAEAVCLDFDWDTHAETLDRVLRALDGTGALGWLQLHNARLRSLYPVILGFRLTDAPQIIRPEDLPDIYAPEPGKGYARRPGVITVVMENLEYFFIPAKPVFYVHVAHSGGMDSDYYGPFSGDFKWFESQVLGWRPAKAQAASWVDGCSWGLANRIKQRAEGKASDADVARAGETLLEAVAELAKAQAAVEKLPLKIPAGDLTVTLRRGADGRGRAIYLDQAPAPLPDLNMFKAAVSAWKEQNPDKACFLQFDRAERFNEVERFQFILGDADVHSIMLQLDQPLSHPIPLDELGIDLKSTSSTTKIYDLTVLADVDYLFSRRSGDRESFHLRPPTFRLGAVADFYIINRYGGERSQYYVQSDPTGSDQKAFYGPFDGDLKTVLDKLNAWRPTTARAQSWVDGDRKTLENVKKKRAAGQAGDADLAQAEATLKEAEAELKKAAAGDDRTGTAPTAAPTSGP